MLAKGSHVHTCTIDGIQFWDFSCRIRDGLLVAGSAVRSHLGERVSTPKNCIKKVIAFPIPRSTPNEISTLPQSPWLPTPSSSQLIDLHLLRLLFNHPTRPRGSLLLLLPTQLLHPRLRLRNRQHDPLIRSRPKWITNPLSRNRGQFRCVQFLKKDGRGRRVREGVGRDGVD